MASKLDSGIFAHDEKDSFVKPMPRDTSIASRVNKNHVFNSKFHIFRRNLGKFIFAPVAQNLEIPDIPGSANVLDGSRKSSFWCFTFR